MSESMTRDQLLENLQRAHTILAGFANLEQQDQSLKKQIITKIPAPAPLPPKYKWNVGMWFVFTFLAFIVLYSLTGSYSYYGNDLYYIVIFALSVGCAFGVKQYMAWKNKEVATINAQHDEALKQAIQAGTQRNKETVAKMNSLAEHMESWRIAWQEDAASWYPPDYMTVDASAYFLKAVTNYQADSIKEAVNLYDEYLHRNAMEAAALRQQQLTSRLNQTLEERMAQNEEMIQGLISISAMNLGANIASAAANVVTAVNTGNIATSAAATARSSAATAQNTARAAQAAGRAADHAANAAAAARNRR